MKPSIAIGAFMLLMANASLVQAAEPSAVTADSAGAGNRVCVLSGPAPSAAQFTVVKELKIGKGTYGSVDEGITMLADKARDLGADAIVNYSGSQRFGFWPWRFVHPVVRGTAIKWNSGVTFDCVASGGSFH